MIEKSRHQRREILYSGHVQGVGFRYTTREIAARFAVAGWVKNLTDGRVQAIVEGTPAELDQFQQALAEAMADRIDQTEVQLKPASGEFDGFQIRH